MRKKQNKQTDAYHRKSPRFYFFIFWYFQSIQNSRPECEVRVLKQLPSTKISTLASFCCMVCFAELFRFARVLTKSKSFVIEITIYEESFQTGAFANEKRPSDIFQNHSTVYWIIILSLIWCDSKLHFMNTFISFSFSFNIWVDARPPYIGQ